MKNQIRAFLLVTLLTLAIYGANANENLPAVNLNYNGLTSGLTPVEVLKAINYQNTKDKPVCISLLGHYEFKEDDSSYTLKDMISPMKES